jgi:hypothetical protein
VAFVLALGALAVAVAELAGTAASLGVVAGVAGVGILVEVLRARRQERG